MTAPGMASHGISGAGSPSRWAVSGGKGAHAWREEPPLRLSILQQHHPHRQLLPESSSVESSIVGCSGSGRGRWQDQAASRRSPCSCSASTSSSSIDGASSSSQVDTSSDGSTSSSGNGFPDDATAKLVAVVGEGSESPFSGIPWHQVLTHTARRLAWRDPGFHMLVHTTTALSTSDPSLSTTLAAADIIIAVSIPDPATAHLLLTLTHSAPTLAAFSSSHPALHPRIRGTPAHPTWHHRLPVPTPSKSAAATIRAAAAAWAHSTSDTLLFALHLLIDAAVAPVPALKPLRARSGASLLCMLRNCGPQVLACLADPRCRAALACLDACAPTDQVCQYRCVTCHETPALAEFTLCALQRHNCLDLCAVPPERPVVDAMAAFRGAELTHAVAEDLLVGWLQELGWSWRVAAGQNAAYDHFPCQYQLFYRAGKAGGAVWYDPVFRVPTDAGPVWRRRHYRVRRGPAPGHFVFTALDNGVVSRELWRVVHVADDLTWGLLYYSGAAAAAGQAYTGAVLVTPDGRWPPPSAAEAVEAALGRCGIEVWELSRVRNDGCGGAPLEVPAGSGGVQRQQPSLVQVASDPQRERTEA